MTYKSKPSENLNLNGFAHHDISILSDAYDAVVAELEKTKLDLIEAINNERLFLNNAHKLRTELAAALESETEFEKCLTQCEKEYDKLQTERDEYKAWAEKIAQTLVSLVHPMVKQRSELIEAYETFKRNTRG